MEHGAVYIRFMSSAGVGGSALAAAAALHPGAPPVTGLPRTSRRLVRRRSGFGL